MSLCYQQLRDLAASFYLASPNGTLQPTLIVHEAYLKLAGAESARKQADPNDPVWTSREHFLAVAATAMRQVVADYARKRRAAKRDPGGSRLDFGFLSPAARDLGAVGVVDLDDALSGLATLDPRAARVVELRFFAGMTVDETAAAIGVSRSTVEGDWRIARAWLLHQTRGSRDEHFDDTRRPHHA